MAPDRHGRGQQQQPRCWQNGRGSAQVQHFNRGGQRNRFADAYRAATGVKCVRTQSHRPSTFRYTSVTHSSALIRCPLK